LLQLLVSIFSILCVNDLDRICSEELVRSPLLMLTVIAKQVTAE
jgi:hypothetical protein